LPQRSADQLLGSHKGLGGSRYPKFCEDLDKKDDVFEPFALSSVSQKSEHPDQGQE
jgi:hypothetical protein